MIADGLTALYCTDNSLDKEIMGICQEYLIEAEIPVISVSQKPIDLGQNICVGEIGRSCPSLIKQMIIGLEAIDTPYVAAVSYTHLTLPTKRIV